MTDNINALDVILIISTSFFLLCWIAWIIKLIISSKRIATKNALLYDRYQQLIEEKKKNDMLENLLDSYHMSEDRAEIQDSRRIFRNLENQVRQTKIFKNVKVSNSELGELVNLEKKQFELMAEDACPFDSVSDWLDSVRIAEAIKLLSGLGDEEQGNDAKIKEISMDCGFSSRRALSNACKRIIGINLPELNRIITKQKKARQ